MHKKVPTIIAAPLIAVFLLRALIPVGYMPSAIADGLPFVLCPDDLPAAFTALFERGGHDGGGHHDHGGHDSASAAQFPDQCDLGDTLSMAGAPADDPPLVDRLPAAAIDNGVDAIHFSQPRFRERARGPPRILQS